MIELNPLDSLSPTHSHNTHTVCRLQVPPSKNPRMKLQCLENLNKILAFLKEKGVRLENIGGEDIHAGHSMLTLGLIWTIILRIQISEIEGADAKNYKAALLAVCCANLDPSCRWKQRC